MVIVSYKSTLLRHKTINYFYNLNSVVMGQRKRCLTMIDKIRRDDSILKCCRNGTLTDKVHHFQEKWTKF